MQLIISGEWFFPICCDCSFSIWSIGGIAAQSLWVVLATIKSVFASHISPLSTLYTNQTLPITIFASSLQNHSPTNNPILIWLINLHIDLVMRAESSPSTLQHQKLLLFNHRNLAAVTLLRGTNKFTETIAAQAMTTLFDDDHLLVLKFLQTRWTSEAMLKPSETRPTYHQSPWSSIRSVSCVLRRVRLLDMRFPWLARGTRTKNKSPFSSVLCIRECFLGSRSSSPGSSPRLCDCRNCSWACLRRASSLWTLYLPSFPQN